MEEFNQYTITQDNVVDGSLIAISVILLTVWFTTGTPDDSSKISFYALVVSLPMLVTDLLLTQMPHIQFSNRVYRFIASRNTNFATRSAFVGIIFAIGHVSGTAAILFMIISFICYIVFFSTLKKTKKSLEMEQKKHLEQNLNN